MIQIYTDGVHKNITKQSAFGAVFVFDDHIEEISGYYPHATVSRIKLQAVISALEHLPMQSHCRVYSNAQYVIFGLNRWLTMWQRNDWILNSGKPLENVDLWQKLFALKQQQTITGHLIKSHKNLLRAKELAKIELLNN